MGASTRYLAFPATGAVYKIPPRFLHGSLYPAVISGHRAVTCLPDKYVLKAGTVQRAARAAVLGEPDLLHGCPHVVLCEVT